MSNLLTERLSSTLEPSSGSVPVSDRPKAGEPSVRQPAAAHADDHHHGHSHGHRHAHGPASGGTRSRASRSGGAGGSAVVAVRPSLLRFGLGTRLAVAALISLAIVAVTSSVLG